MQALQKKSKSALVQEKINLSFSAGGSGVRWGKLWASPGEVFVWKEGFLREGQGMCERLQSLQPGPEAQGAGLLHAILRVSHPAVTAAPTSPSYSFSLPTQAAFAIHAQWP